MLSTPPPPVQHPCSLPSSGLSIGFLVETPGAYLHGLCIPRTLQVLYPTSPLNHTRISSQRSRSIPPTSLPRCFASPLYPSPSTLLLTRTAYTHITPTHAISAVLPSLSLSAFPPHSPIQGSTGSQVYLSLSLSLLANFFSYCLYYMTPATSVHRPNNHPLPHLLPPDTFASLKRAVSFICCMRPMC